jgi:hypothetical protein
MWIVDNLFACYVLKLRAMRRRDPKFHAKGIIFLLLGTFMLTMLNLFELISGAGIFTRDNFPSRLHYIPLFAPLMLFMYFYFTRKRVNIIEQRFNDQSLSSQKMWRLLAGIIPILIIILFFIGLSIKPSDRLETLYPRNK